MRPPTELDHRIAGVAALDQPLRRTLYRLLSDRDGWTTRDEAAEALGVARSVAAFHLDKLADAGVLDVTYQRTTGRTGPGAGRPSKLYRPRADEVSASVPERRYDLAGSLLASAVDEAGRTGAPVADAVGTAAYATGRRIGEEAGDAAVSPESGDDRRPAVLDVLARHGYQPEVGDHDEVALANCPFHRLAQEHRALVCGMNLDLVRGLLDGMGATDQLAARLAPEPGYCCVRITAA
ncbi:MAG TPA: helix-turn-helix domain-containing protein [Acidimicrobiales bacterium]|nr:helix-turn-helix domain-containing protein [Acidimicrobiales bacterium]